MCSVKVIGHSGYLYYSQCPPTLLTELQCVVPKVPGYNCCAHTWSFISSIVAVFGPIFIGGPDLT